jgi:ribonucleoside-diphosphate reductase beta chain
MSVFKINKKDSTTRKMFLDGQVDIQRYDTMKYKNIDKMTERQIGFFWQPTEVDVSRDSKDFKELTENEQHIFTSNLKRQILLDSVQGRSPSLTLLPLTSLPELESWITLWTQNEGMHSRSYTHIIRNVYSDPSVVFDEMLDIKEIIDCSVSVTKDYDKLHELAMQYQLLGIGTHNVNGKTIVVDEYEIKKSIWLVLNSINVIEGIRFYVSFACSWAFAELKQMEGNAKLIKLICRDENLHLAFTQSILKMLPKDDADFAKIQTECADAVREMFLEAVQQEIEWAEYLFKDGSMIGLNKQLLTEYVHWIANKRMHTLGIDCPFKTGGSDPLPWTQKWIAGGDVQVAPQEVQLSSYIVGGTKQDVGEDSFKGFEL